MRHWIVEHATRGVLVEKVLDHANTWPYVKARYRFSWSITRSDEKVEAFYDLKKAQAAAAATKGAYVLEVTSVRRLDGSMQRKFKKLR